MLASRWRVQSPSSDQALRQAVAEAPCPALSQKAQQLQGVGAPGARRHTKSPPGPFLSDEERRWDFVRSGLSLTDWISSCQGCLAADTQQSPRQRGVVSMLSIASNAAPLETHATSVRVRKADSRCPRAGKIQSCVMKRPSCADSASRSLQRPPSSVRRNAEDVL